MLARKLAAVVIAIVFAGVAFAGTTAMYDVTPVDLIAAWPSTGRHGDSVLRRILVYPAAIHGRATARQDIAAGHLRLKRYGLIADWPRYVEVLQAHGIETTVVAGCIVSQPSLASWDGYNDVMRAEIDRRYGPNFLDDLAEQAMEER